MDIITLNKIRVLTLRKMERIEIEWATVNLSYIHRPRIYEELSLQRPSFCNPILIIAQIWPKLDYEGKSTIQG